MITMSKWDVACTESSLMTRPRRLLLPFDRPTDGFEEARAQAVFYFDATSSESENDWLLTYLNVLTNKSPSFGYTVRYKPPRERSSGARSGLSGYGVELALKNTDYLVVDDRAGQTASAAKAVTNEPGFNQGFFSEVLGNDPWSELSVPLTKQEIQGEWFSYLTHSFVSSYTDNRRRFKSSEPYFVFRRQAVRARAFVARFPQILCCSCSQSRCSASNPAQAI
jgi:hypothetical protein